MAGIWAPVLSLNLIVGKPFSIDVFVLKREQEFDMSFVKFGLILRVPMINWRNILVVLVAQT